MRWETLKNGKLLDQAQTQFDVLLTVDRGIEHQQNLAARPIAVIVLIARNNSRVALEPLMPEVNALLPTAVPGRVYKVQKP